MDLDTCLHKFGPNTALLRKPIDGIVYRIVYTKIKKDKIKIDDLKMTEWRKYEIVKWRCEIGV